MAKQERKVKELFKSHFRKKWNWLKKQWDCLKNCFYKHRVSFLLVAFLFGLGLSSLGIWWIHRICLDSDFVYKASKKLLTERNWLIIAGLPVAFCLWLFRTKDRKDQIEKTRENTQASLLSNNLTLLTSANVDARAVGLVQLLQLRNKEKVYKDQIDIATPGINLERARLMRADLQDAQLQGADLGGTNLEHANLQEANLEGADLLGADLQGANLQYAGLRNTKLQGADLRNAKLQGAQLQDADLRGANLEYADLQEANLGDAQLQSANLQNANLQGANLADADLQNANLQYANLQKANLQDADLRNADLHNTYLQNAYLRNANLLGTNVLKTKFEGAQYNTQTIPPHDNFKPEEHGMKFDPESMK